jgi:hypothetical protein
MSSVNNPNISGSGPVNYSSSPSGVNASRPVQPKIAALAAKVGPLQMRMPSMTRSPAPTPTVTPTVTPATTPPLTPVSSGSEPNSPRFSSEVRGSASFLAAPESVHHQQAAEGLLKRAKNSIIGFFKSSSSPEEKIINTLNSLTEIREKIKAGVDIAGLKNIAAAVAKLEREASRAGISGDSAVADSFKETETLLASKSFNFILASPKSASFEAFRAHLKQEHSEENLNFYFAAEAFIDKPTERAGISIVDNYLRRASKGQVNQEINVAKDPQVIASANMRMIVDKNLDPLKELVQGYQKDIHKLMENDSFARFYKTPANFDLIKKDLGI